MSCQSIIIKISELLDYVINHDVDVVALTETWLKDDDKDNSKSIDYGTPSEYNIKHIDRSGQKSGAVGMLFRKNKCPWNGFFSENEIGGHLDICITTSGVTFRTVVVYRLHPN